MKQCHIGLVVLSDRKSLAPHGTACWARNSVGDAVVTSSFRKKNTFPTYVHIACGTSDRILQDSTIVSVRTPF